MRSRLALGTLVRRRHRLAHRHRHRARRPAGLPGLRGAADLLAPPAAAAELVPFEDCDELLRWYVEQALPEVGPYGLGGWPVVALDRWAVPTLDSATVRGDRRRAGAADLGRDQAESSGTGTNVQEVGRRRARPGQDRRRPGRARARQRPGGHRRHAAPSPARSARCRCPATWPGRSCCSSGDTVLVARHAAEHRRLGRPDHDRRARSAGRCRTRAARGRATAGCSRSRSPTPRRPGSSRTRRSAGRWSPPASTATRCGWCCSTVRAGARLRPAEPRAHRQGGHRGEPADPPRAADRGLAADGPQRGGEGEPLVDCADVRHPAPAPATAPSRSSRSTPRPRPTCDALGVTTERPDRLLLDRPALPRHRGRAGNSTEVHAFALDGATTSYVASGTVRGVRRGPLEHGRARRRAAAGRSAHGPGWSPEGERHHHAARGAATSSRSSAPCAASARTSRSSPCAGSTTWRSS